MTPTTPAFSLPASRTAGLTGRSLLTAALSALWLTACSGLGPAADGSDAAPAQQAAAAASRTCASADLQRQAVMKLNAYRNSGARCGLSGQFSSAAPVAWSDKLARAAALHSQDLARRQQLDHQGSDGSSLTDRLEAQGYRWTHAAENVATGQTDLSRALADWVASPAHCANMMARQAQQIGLACRSGEDGRLYWTLVLAAPTEAAPTSVH